MAFNTAYADAIASIESGGKYGILGPRTKSGDRAYGKYQVMGNNIGPWTKEILGRAMTPDEFLADNAAQEAVFEGKFSQSIAKYGNPQDAASVWFSGRPMAKAGNSSDILGTTVPSYVAKFNKALGMGAPVQTASPLSLAPPSSSPLSLAPPSSPQSSGIFGGLFGKQPAQAGAAPAGNPMLSALMEQQQQQQKPMQAPPIEYGKRKPADMSRFLALLSNAPESVRGLYSRG